MGKSPEAMKSKENYDKFQQLVFDHMKREKEKEAMEKIHGKDKKK